MSSLAFFLMVLHISVYSIRCLSSPFSTISRRFVIRARVGDDILDFSGLLIVLATFDVLSKRNQQKTAWKALRNLVINVFV